MPALPVSPQQPVSRVPGTASKSCLAVLHHPQLHEESVTLHGGERMVVHLRVVPLRPGTLQVHGLSWLLNGVAHGQAAFCIPQPRPRKPGSSSK